MSYRIKLVVFLLCAITILLLFNTAYQGLDTLSRLNVVEAERDQWQRPSDVIQALDLRPGDVVVDLGCGSGYFTLKLSAPVGQSGSVLAEDIRRFPLAFLWFRKFLKNERNVKVLHGDPNDPHLPIQGANAVLIANTYHEFTESQSILAHVFRSLVLGGRLVVVDRGPQSVATSRPQAAAEREISAEQVQSELVHAGFEIVSRQDRFIDRGGDDQLWWLIVVKKPGP